VEVFEFSEEAFHCVALFVNTFGKGHRCLAVPFGQDIGPNASFFGFISNSITTISR
jgi:hypothetical protein